MMKFKLNSDNLKARFNKLGDNADDIAKEAVTQLGAVVLDTARAFVPVDTGDLKKSITLEVKQGSNGAEANIGSALPYAPMVELGIGQKPQPYLRPALHEARMEMGAVMKAVMKKYGN